MPVHQYSREYQGYLLHVETVFIKNVAAGNSAADIIVEDAIIHSMLITNYGGQAAPRVIARDRQSTPRSFAIGASVIVGVGGAVMMESESGIPASEGLNVVCDTASACEIKVVWRRPWRV